MRMPAYLLALLLGGLAVTSRADQLSRLTGAEAVEAWVRLKGDAGGATTFEWVSGSAFGVPADGPSVLLFRMESVTVRRFEKIGPASYIEKNYACRLYRDPQSGEFVDHFLNPLTGRDVVVTSRCSAAPAVRYTPDKVELLSDMKFESTALGGPMQLEKLSLGDVTVIRRNVRAQFVSPSTGELRRELSVDSFTTTPRALANKKLRMLAPAYHWEAVGGWMADLAMGDRPGRMLWSVFGRNYRTVEALPADFRQALLQRVPDALQRPLN
jgi:hypothetical protein